MNESRHPGAITAAESSAHPSLPARAPDAGSPSGPAPAPRGLLVVLIPLMLVLFIATLDQTIVATAIPGIGRALHDLTSAPWIATAYLLTSAVSTLILGKLGDMYGRKKVFQFSVIVFLIGSLLSGLAGSMPLLIVFRGLQGIGGGGAQFAGAGDHRGPDPGPAAREVPVVPGHRGHAGHHRRAGAGR